MASAIVAEHVTYPSDNAAIAAYLARPTGSGPWPAVIVIHEIWGLDPHIEDITRRFVPEGYVGLAPDLYSRHGMPVSREEIATAMAQAGKSFTYQIYPGAPHAFVNDTRATYRPEAATNAWQRVLAFFQIGLKQDS